MSGSSAEGNSAGRPKVGIILRDRLFVAVSLSLVVASAVAWAASVYLAPQMMDTTMPTMGLASIVSSLSLNVVALFEFVWVVGMAAMMFPAMIPIVLFYNRFVARSDLGSRSAAFLGTPLLLTGYLAMYAALGVAAYLGVYEALALPAAGPWLASVALIAPGIVLIVAALYQLTPLKSTCLSNCVSPMGFFTRHNRRGLAGALEMGVSHGAYCVGCCWAYMLVMLVVGLMSIPAMVVLAAVIAVEKVVVRGNVWFTRGVALALGGAGIISILFPAIFGSML